MKNRCDTCKHWFSLLGDNIRGTCEVTTSVHEGGFTLVVDVDEGVKAEAEMKTNYQFGCTLWENWEEEEEDETDSII